MVTLYGHQRTALDLLRLNDGFCLFMEQGTGKTFPVLFRLAELAATGRIGTALVVAPKAVCASWRDKVAMLSEGQQDALASIEFEVASYDLVWRRDEYAGRVWDAVVLDEAHFIKSPSAKRTKACLKLCAAARYRWLLTGTPVSNGALCDVWTLMAACDPVVVKGRVYPACLGGDSYYAWLDRVAYLDKWHKPFRYRHVDQVQETLGEFSYRVTKAECLDLPEKLPDELLRDALPTGAAKLYRQMEEHSAIEVLDMLAPNPLTRSLRLRQICSGFVSEDGRTEELPCWKPKALSELLSGREGKAVVFCEFRHSIDVVVGLLEETKVGHVVLAGRSKGDEWRRFQEDPEVRAIVCQYQSGSAGIDLYAADLMVFYEPTLSSVLLEQARDRIHRPGQHRPCSYVFLITPKTIEVAIYRALVNFSDFTEALFREYMVNYRKGQKI